MHSVFSLVGTLDRVIARLEIVVIASSVLIMAINSIANVIGRYLFSYSLYFSEELNQFLMVLITFIGLSYMTRKGRHIRMSAIYDMLDDRLKKGVMILICLSTAIVMFVLAYYAYEYIAKLAMRGKVSPALRVPVYLTMICLPVGFTLAGIQYLMTIARNLRSDLVYISATQVDSYECNDTDADHVAASSPADGKIEVQAKKYALANNQSLDT